MACCTRKKCNRFSQEVDATIEFMERDINGGNSILKSWELQEDGGVVCEGERKVLLETPCPKYSKGIGTFEKGKTSWRYSDR